MISPRRGSRPASGEPLPGTTGADTAGQPEAFVLFEKGAIESRVVHDQERVDQRREERALEALAQRYAKYAATSENAAHLRAVRRRLQVPQRLAMTEEPRLRLRAAALSSARELLDLERSEGRAEPFAAVDALIGDVVIRALQAERVVESERGRNTATVSLAGLAPEAQETLLSQFSLEAQHAKGSWFIPEKVSLKTGLANLPWTFANYPRYASGIVWEEKASVLPSVVSRGSCCFWAVFQPLFEQLFAPFELRGRLSGTKSAEDQLAIWAAVDAIVDALGFEVDDELAVMRYGAGWGSLRAPEQLAAKQRLLEPWPPRRAPTWERATGPIGWRR